MRRINTFDFVQLGMRLEPIKKIQEESPINDYWIDLWMAREHLKTLLQNASLNLRTSVQPIYKVINSIGEIIDGSETKKIDRTKPADDFELYQLQKSLDELLAVLAAELNVIDTYSISQKGAYSTSDLVDHSEIMIREDIRNKLDKIQFMIFAKQENALHLILQPLPDFILQGELNQPLFNIIVKRLGHKQNQN